MDKEVQFEIDTTGSVHSQPRKLGLAGLVVKYSNGRVADERQANYVLLGFVVLMVAISLYLLSGNSTEVGHPTDIKALPAIQ